MGAVGVDEVRPGLVVHLDTDVLRALGGSATSALLTNGVDRAVHGPHYFLILLVEDGIAQAVPLYSQGGVDRVMLDEGAKLGVAEKWIGTNSYFFKWQHWLVPVEHVALASDRDEAQFETRRRYLPGGEELSAIAALKDESGNPFRAA